MICLGTGSPSIHFGGLDSNSKTNDGTHVTWVQRDLVIGDVVEFEVIERDEADRPTKAHRHGFSTEAYEAERVRSAEHYLKEYSQQRDEADRQIAHLERFLASRSGKTRSPRSAGPSPRSARRGRK